MLIRIIATFAILLGFQGGTFTDLLLVNVLFRALFIASGVLSFFKNRIGITLLILALILSIPDIQKGDFYWTPVRFIRFPVGFSLNGAEEQFRLGIDFFSILLLSLLIPASNND